MNISEEKKKELKESYKQHRPEMGIYGIINKAKNKYYVNVTQDLSGTMNGDLFKLKANLHKNKVLQEDWNLLGEEAFEVKILDVLAYDEKDGAKTDYSDDLALLKMTFVYKFANEGIRLY